MKLIYCGTPQFAVPTLQKLLERGHAIELVLTNPDEPAGRGHDVKPSAVKEAASKAGLRLYQPAKLKTAETQVFLSNFKPDAIVVAAYGHILPPWMLRLARLGCVNLHASLLPKYRGAAPIPWAIIRGETKTGATTMLMDEGLDTGAILLQRGTEIRDDDTTETLSERLARMGAELMAETLEKFERGELKPVPQDSRAATLAPMLKKEDGRLDWSLDAAEIARRIRGFRPWPGAFTSFRGKSVHVWAASPGDESAPTGSAPGALIAKEGRLLVACGQSTLLELKEVQLEGRKRVSGRDFANGVRLRPGEKFG